MKDFNIQTTEAQKLNFVKQVQEKYIDALVTQLHNRLPDIRELEVFSILDPCKLPKKSDPHFQQYGNRQLDESSAYYGTSDNTDVSRELLQSEWVALKPLLPHNYGHKKHMEFLVTLSTDTTLSTVFPNFSKLSAIARILPVRTAHCERCFSTMKRIKTAARNRMETETLNRLMRVSIEGPALNDFDFDRAADQWESLRKRRITVTLT